MSPPHFHSNYDFGYRFSGIMVVLGWVTIAAGAFAILAFVFSVDRHNPLNWAGITGAFALGIQGVLLIAISTFLKAHFDSAAATKTIEWYVAKSFVSSAPKLLHKPKSYEHASTESFEPVGQTHDTGYSGHGLKHRGYVIPLKNGKYVVNNVEFHNPGPAKEYLNRLLVQGDPVDLQKL